MPAVNPCGARPADWDAVIAVDCDVDDAEIAQGIYKILCGMIGKEPPRRTRADSARFVLTFVYLLFGGDDVRR